MSGRERENQTRAVHRLTLAVNFAGLTWKLGVIAGSWMYPKIPHHNGSSAISEGSENESVDIVMAQNKAIVDRRRWAMIRCRHNPVVSRVLTKTRRDACQCAHYIGAWVW